MIPQTIHRIWIGGEPLPKYAQDFDAAARALHPDWHHELWTDARLADIPMSDDYRALVEAAPYMESKSDLLRYAILFAFGGFYLDCDVEPLRSFESLRALPFDAFFAGLPNGFSAFMASTPQHAAMRRVLERLEATLTVDALRNGRGPGWGTAEAHKYLLHNWHIAMLPSLMVCCPPAWPERRTAYACHWQKFDIKRCYTTAMVYSGM